MTGILLLIGLGILIYYLSRGKGTKTTIASPEARLAERNVEWSRFIAGYRNVVKTKSEKALVERMLSDIKAQGLIATVWEMPEATSERRAFEPAPATQAYAAAAVEYEPVITPAVPDVPKVELDNVSLLLYFGAFLFVASVGLFIVFGGASGVIRTFAVLLMTAGLYWAGIWLFHNKPKLEQAGIAFTGIGMTIAPLSGVAAYNYLFAQTNGPAVWFATSLLCMAMYTHALWTFRKPLVSYILIFTFLSLFESGVSIISAPIYYFGWAMALVGIILSLAGRLKGFWPELQEPSQASSQVILPLAVLTSAVLVPGHGAGQLGISLLFAAAFYGLEALNTKDSQQQNNVITAHISALLGVVCLSYATSSSWKFVAVTVLIINLVQALSMIMLPQTGSQLWRNFATVALGTSAAGVVVAGSSSGIMLASTAALVVLGLIVWLRQYRLEAYVISAIAWMALPVVFGQYFVAFKLDPASQVALLFSALLVQLGVYLWFASGNKDAYWKTAAQQVYLLSCGVVLVASLFASAWVCFAISLGVVATMILLAEDEHDTDWAVIAGTVAIVPIIRGVGVPGALVASTMTALLLNIILSLRYRKESNRWLSTGIWLVLPLSLGSGLLGDWTTATYGWAYLLVMLSLVLSRTIARGALLVSARVPLASYAKSASLSYVAGYWTAAVLAICISLVSENAQFHATAVLTAISIIIFYLGRYVEKRSDILLTLPLLSQAVLWSALRPTSGTDSMIVYLLSSTALAAASYFALSWSSNETDEQETFVRIREGALASIFIAPAAILVVPELLWPMPFGLLIAGLIMYHHIRETSQQNRELAGGLITASILWFLWFAGIREVQVYSHVLVALLGFYAYWRATRNETIESDQYLMVMLATATIPLAAQAIGGQAGGLYGWWLLLEQIAFMLIGMAIKKRTVTLWGLYVAVGAVLYQLRHLGWAALTVLAVFLIGIAIYKLQKHTDKS